MKNVIIDAKHLCKSFILGKNGIHVIKNVDLEIYEKDFTVIMGSSGSGKSTLLYSISSMDRPTEGRVTVLGEDITKLSEKEIANFRKNKVSFVFQGINLLPDLTAFENVTYPAYGTEKKEVINERAKDLLEEFGLWDEKDKYPTEMSGGQQQRVAIARSLVGGAKIIFCDEPTGALNSSSGQVVLDSLTKLNEDGLSIVMVTHDIKGAARASRLLYLKDGRIDGELYLGKYNEKEQKTREETIFEFLNKKGW